jgi:hypothetical protein
MKPAAVTGAIDGRSGRVRCSGNPVAVEWSRAREIGQMGVGTVANTGSDQDFMGRAKAIGTTIVNETVGLVKRLAVALQSMLKRDKS